MRIRVIIEYNVNETIAKTGWWNVKRLVRELVESWPNSFKIVNLSVEKVK